MKVCIVPARGGSRRIPRKNIKEFAGKPILAFSIETALESDLFDCVYVSTDDAEIADVAARYGASVLWRAEELARDEVGTQQVMAAHLRAFSFEVDYACCIYATAPLLTKELLQWAFFELETRPEAAYAFSVGDSPLHDAGQFYLGHAQSFITQKPLVWPNSIMIPVPPQRVCDINVESDWLRAEKMYAALHPELIS